MILNKIKLFIIYFAIVFLIFIKHLDIEISNGDSIIQSLQEKSNKCTIAVIRFYDK